MGRLRWNIAYNRATSTASKKGIIKDEVALTTGEEEEGLTSRRSMNADSCPSDILKEAFAAEIKLSVMKKVNASR